MTVLTETLSNWDEDRAPRLGASLAFYALFSLAPLLLVVTATAAVVYGQKAAEGQLFGDIRGLVGPERAAAIQGLLQSAYKPAAGMLATILGLLTLALGATSVVVELRDALNTIWHVPQPPESRGLSGLFQLAKDRFYAFGLILGGGVLLLVSVAGNTAISVLAGTFHFALPAPEFVLQAGTFLFSFLVMTLLFAAVYKILPEVPLRWSDVIVGALVTAFLFEVGKQIIGLYVGRSSFGSAYGAAGSIVILLAWVYYSAQVFFLGAEFTKVYTRRRIAGARRGYATPVSRK